MWAATDTVLGRQVAVKILRDDLVDSAVFLERFRAEARHTAGLAHRGIASVFDYGEDHVDGRCVAYLVMELVAGQPLSKVMHDRGAMPVNEVLSLLAQTADALHAAHVAGASIAMSSRATYSCSTMGRSRSPTSASPAPRTQWR